MTRNLLDQETSPYLLQHKDNPVYWQPWSDRALAEAAARNKPILLSIGYAACHWCHVMAHESFESDMIAQIMNDGFINIKVDREERPDLDAIYQSALTVLGEQGGWPLTMFLRPDGSPFWGGTYFPPQARYGRPGFADVLTHISRLYETRPDQVSHNADAIGEALRRMGRTDATGSTDTLTMETVDEVAVAALRLIDFRLGGTSGAPKFPQPTFFRFLWSSYLRTRDRRLFEAVTVTLDNLCQGGIYDHLGGGFSRYAVDSHWLVPHFEKMLYDNALLVDLLCDAWQETGRALYATRVRETISWMLSDLRNPAPEGYDDQGGNNGLFALAGAFDADSEGEEGKYYVWSQADVDTHLGDDAAEFSAAYDVTPDGNWEGRTILRRRVEDMDRDAARAARLADCRERLLAVRRTRVPPQRDDKVLADWNGMAVAALARAGGLFDEPLWIESAKTIYAFVKTRMCKNGRLYHTWCAGRARHPAVLDDYAHMARAALALLRMTHDEHYLKDARAWVHMANTHYRDEDDGAYFMAANDTGDLVVRTKALFDNAVPSGNGVMLEVLAHLYHLSGDRAYGDQAHALASALAPEDRRALMNQPSLMLGFEMLDRGLQVVVIAPAGAGDAEAVALVNAARKSAPPHAVIALYPSSRALPAAHPACGKEAAGGRATAYVCRASVCGLPLSSPEDLVAALSSGR